MPLRIVLVACLFLCANVLSRPTSRTLIERQALILLSEDSVKARRVFIRKLPRDYQVIAVQGPFVWLQGNAPLASPSLQELESLPYVKRAEKNAFVPFMDPDHANLTPGQARSEAKEGAPPKRGESCAPLRGPRCEDGRLKLWAQHRVGAFIAARHIKTLFAKRNGSSVPTKVAVVDSGFQVTGVSDRIHGTAIKVLPGWEGTIHPKGELTDTMGDPAKDRYGHGTSVIGLIKGASGIGIATESTLTSYRAAGGIVDAFGGASRAAIALSLERACADGNEIINLSMGSPEDENGSKLDEETDRELIQRLGERGCLVVKAAGNDGYKKRVNKDDPDDAWLRVGATEASGGLSEFSSGGEVSAPGKAVYSLLAPGSTIENLTKAKGNSCSGDGGAFISGTSFSAPLTSAVASEVVRVLKLSPGYKKLAGPDKIKLITRTLRASQAGGSINFLRAVLIAENWVESGVATIPDYPGDPIWIPNSRGLYSCTEKPKCQDDGDCTKYGDCIEDKRTQFTVCQPPSHALTSELANAFLEGGFPSEAIYYTRSLIKSGGAPESIRPLVSELWRRAHETSDGPPKGEHFDLNFDTRAELLPIYFASQHKDGEGRGKIREALSEYLSSGELQSRILDDVKKGSASDREAVLAVLAAAIENSDAKTVRNVLDAAYTTNTDQAFEAFVQLSEDLLAASEAGGAFAAGRKEWGSFSDRLYSDFSEGKRLESYPRFPRHKSVIALANRNADALSAQANGSLQTGSLSKLSANEVTALCRDSAVSDFASRVDFCFSVLIELARANHWGDYGSFLLRGAFETVEKAEIAPETQAAYQKRLADVLRESKDEAFLWEMPYWANRAPETFFSKAAKADLAHRLQAGLLAKSNEAFTEAMNKIGFDAFATLSWHVNSDAGASLESIVRKSLGAYLEVWSAEGEEEAKVEKSVGLIKGILNPLKDPQVLADLKERKGWQQNLSATLVKLEEKFPPEKRPKGFVFGASPWYFSDVLRQLLRESQDPSVKLLTIQLEPKTNYFLGN